MATNTRNVFEGKAVLAGGVKPAEFYFSEDNMPSTKYSGSMFITGSSWWGMVLALFFSHNCCLDSGKSAVEIEFDLMLR